MNINYRLLEKEDYYKGFLNVINYFTKNKKLVSYENFSKHYNKIINQNSIIYVAEHENKIIGTAKLFIEYKFNNNLTKMGHIEDVVIEEKYRGNGIGKKLIIILLEEAKKKNCYKVSLCSSQKNKDFYIKCGFKVKDLEMTKYFK